MKLINAIALPLILGICPVIATPAYADATCTMTLSNVALDSFGSVIVNLSNGAGTFNWYVCSLQASITVNNNYSTGALTSSTCAGIYSQLLTARSTAKTITMGFHGSGSLPINGCGSADLPPQYTWISPFPVYISY